jgi:hypothetical protein
MATNWLRQTLLTGAIMIGWSLPAVGPGAP